MAYKQVGTRRHNKTCNCRCHEPDGVDLPVRATYTWYSRRHARWVPRYATNRDGSRGELYCFAYAHSTLRRHRWWAAAKFWEAVWAVERWYQPYYRRKLDRVLMARSGARAPDDYSLPTD